MHTPFHGLSTLFSIHVAKELDHDLIICLEERASWSFTASEEPCLCLILAFFRTNWWCRAPHRKHSQQCSDHLSQHTQWCLCLRALAHNLCWTQLQWFKILLISSCLSCLSPGNESMHPSCSAAAAASPTYYLKSTLATAWHQDIRLRMWKWVKAVQAEGQVETCAWEYLKTTLSVSPELWVSHRTEQRLEKGSFGFRELGPKASQRVSLQWWLFSLHFQFTDTLHCCGGEGYISIRKSKLIGVWIYACYPYFGFSFCMKRLFLTSTKET